MPFIVFGTILAAFAMLLLPIADPHAVDAVILYSFRTDAFAMATYRSPAVALIP